MVNNYTCIVLTGLLLPSNGPPLWTATPFLKKDLANIMCCSPAKGAFYPRYGISKFLSSFGSLPNSSLPKATSPSPCCHLHVVLVDFLEPLAQGSQEELSWAWVSSNQVLG